MKLSQFSYIYLCNIIGIATQIQSDRKSRSRRFGRNISWRFVFIRTRPSTQHYQRSRCDRHRCISQGMKLIMMNENDIINPCAYNKNDDHDDIYNNHTTTITEIENLNFFTTKDVKKIFSTLHFSTF